LRTRIELAPELVLFGILPPLSYSAGVAISWRESRFNLRPITLLAVGCVVFTTCAVAAVRGIVTVATVADHVRAFRSLVISNGSSAKRVLGLLHPMRMSNIAHAVRAPRSPGVADLGTVKKMYSK
jgi:hypothetical protein